MALYLISYDLHKVRNYEALYEVLHNFKAVRLHESLWLAELIGPAETVRNIIATTVDADDSIAVIELERTAEWAVRRCDKVATDWLSKHIPAHDRVS